MPLVCLVQLKIEHNFLSHHLIMKVCEGPMIWMRTTFSEKNWWIRDPIGYHSEGRSYSPHLIYSTTFCCCEVELRLSFLELTSDRHDGKKPGSSWDGSGIDSNNTWYFVAITKSEASHSCSTFRKHPIVFRRSEEGLDAGVQRRTKNCGIQVFGDVAIAKPTDE